MIRGPDVSIVICTYNRADSLHLTLDALGAQVTPVDLAWEIVVVNNNSNDATAAVVNDFASRARVPVLSIFLADQGLSRARNAGVCQAEGGVIGFTDDDVDPERGWVARIAAVMAEGAADIVGGRILPAWRQPPPRWLEHRAFFHGALAIMDYATAAPVLSPSNLPSIWGANMAFRRSVFDKAGLFDPARGLIGTKLYRGEEIDLIKRAIAAGYRAIYDPSIVVWHRIEPDRMRVRYLSRLYFQRAEGEALMQTPIRCVGTIASLLYRCRVAARGLVSWVAAMLMRRPNTIERWLECCDAVGFMWGLCKLYYIKNRPRTDRSV